MGNIETKSSQIMNIFFPRKFKLFKKSQMEILGLAIVVVLILMATIFVIRFLVFKAPVDYRKSFVSSELASNMLSTFLKTAAKECANQDMTALLQDCAQSRSIICDNGQNSCLFVESVARNVFSRTFEKWNMVYEFKTYTDINSPLIRLGNPCEADKKSKLFPIPSALTIYVNLDICG